MLPASSGQLFRFCQLDYSFPLGPADGRYLARAGEEDLDVIIFTTLGAARRPARGRRPKRATSPQPPAPVSISRVTVIDSDGFEDEDAATDWLERCRKDERESDACVADALGVVNRAIRAYRVSAADPYVRELTPDRAQAVRLGYGEGDELVEGRWRSACTLPAGRVKTRRRQMLAPQEQLAAILSGRSAVQPSEDLALRARLDHEQGRTREAALQLRAAVDALEAESDKREELAATRARVHELADAALSGALGDEQVSALADLLGGIERTLRRRRHAGG